MLTGPGRRLPRYGALHADGRGRRAARREQPVDMPALEQMHAALMTEAHRIRIVATRDDHARLADTLDRCLHLGRALRTRRIAEIGRPEHLDEIDAETLAIDIRQRQRRHAIEADAVAALADVIAREDVGADVVEDVDLLDLDDDATARARAQALIESLELRRQQRRDVEVEAIGMRERAVITATEHRQHAAIERLRQILEQPAIGRDIALRHHRIAQLGNRDIDLAIDRLRRLVLDDRANRLAADDVG